MVGGFVAVLPAADGPPNPAPPIQPASRTANPAPAFQPASRTANPAPTPTHVRQAATARVPHFALGPTPTMRSEKDSAEQSTRSVGSRPPPRRANRCDGRSPPAARLAAGDVEPGTPTSPPRRRIQRRPRRSRCPLPAQRRGLQQLVPCQQTFASVTLFCAKSVAQRSFLHRKRFVEASARHSARLNHANVCGHSTSSPGLGRLRALRRMSGLGPTRCRSLHRCSRRAARRWRGFRE